MVTYLLTRSTRAILLDNMLSTSWDSSCQMAPPRKTKPLVSSRDLESARSRLLALERDEGSTEVEARDKEQREIVIVDNVTVHNYLKFVDSEPKLSAKIGLMNGKVVVYDIPLLPHGQVVAEIIGGFSTWGGLNFRTAAEVDLIVGANSVCCADLTIRPRQRQRPPPALASDSLGSAYPTMVVEIANIQSIGCLHALAESYLSPRTTIQVYLGIKLYRPRENGTMAMLILMYQRSRPTPTIPTIAMSFGTVPIHNRTVSFLHQLGVPDALIIGVGRHGVPACDGLGILVYQLNIPAVQLYNGVSGGVLATAVNGYDLDLWRIQQAALDS
ncbi:hypothetical protein BC938DRAFT_476331 [Jimgerdemannia flammicorona]|uniref:Restriction endonuclease domain-containing protein n=1 Tax=Jimgerdemannia flammicorona TaxID=994334 RepID=A0A433QQK8_9FUNG|nr:hypothetical protein BC938DRAFT_476331 [Jimgerdemannia flammicorona]